MNYRGDDRVRECISSLAILLNDEKPSESEIDHAIRTLRPATHRSRYAYKEAIEKAIMERESDGPHRLVKFGNECEKLGDINKSLVPPTLALLSKLKFPTEQRRPAGIHPKHTTPKHSEFTNSTNEPSPVYHEKVRPPGAVRNEPSGIPSIVPRSLDRNVVPSSVGAKLRNSDTPWNGSTELQLLVDSQVMWCTKEVENKLITDLIFVMQGLNGKYIKYDVKSECYVVDPALKLQGTVKDTVLCLCELGWLYTKVQEYVASVTCEKSSNYCGLVTQAFGYSIQEEMHDYFKLLSVLEQEAKRSAALFSSFQAQPTTAVATREEVEEPSGLTLLRMKAWLQEPIDRMCLIARLVDSARPLSGGALASRLFFYTRHGDNIFCQLVQRMMHSVCDPIYHIIIRWILFGELNDPHDEFFIGMQTMSANKTPITNMWKETYYLRQQMLPSFLTLALAQKILIIGKSINFIKACIPKLSKEITSENTNLTKRGSKRSFRSINKTKKLTTGGRVIETYTNANDGDDSTIIDRDDLTVISELPVHEVAISNNVTVIPIGGKTPSRAQDILGDITTPEVENSLKELCFGKEQSLTEIVTSISSAIDLRLLKLMEERFHIQTHFLALKKFMLLGQGDFVTGLMDGVGPELKKRASMLFRHNLTGILEGAIRASNAQFEPSFVSDRLGIRLLEAGAGVSGWEIFSLDYTVDVPLNAIVDNEAMAKYRIAFHMLWRLKRIEWTLSNAWKHLASFTHENNNELTYHLKVVFHKCSLHRARMMHVVNNLCAFLMFEVMESAWVTLQEKVRSATSINDVIAAHEAYLNEILDKALLAPKHEAINMMIQQLLQSILIFCNLEDNLISDALACVAAKRVEMQRIEDRTRQGMWGTTGVTEAPDNKYGGVQVYMIERLEESVSVYNAQFDALMAVLKERGETTGEILKFLTFRLDFNDYHQLQRVGKLTHIEVSPMHATGGLNPGSGVKGVRLFNMHENVID